MTFEEKYLSCYIILTHQISVSGSCTLSNIAIIGKPGCDVMGFENNLIVLTKSFFWDEQKIMTRTKISSEQKELLRWNKKHFHHF